MLVASNHRLIERIVTDSYGRQYRVVFAVSMVDGQLRGRIVSATEIKALAGKAAAPYCLSGRCSATPTAEPILSPFAPVLSPFTYELESLITSQPTRAPSRA